MFGIVFLFSLLIEFIMGIFKVILIAIGFILLLVAILSSNDKGFKPFYTVLGILIIVGGLSSGLEHGDTWSWVITGSKGFSEVSTLLFIAGIVIIIHIITNFSSSSLPKKENKKKKITCKIKYRKPIKYRISNAYNRSTCNLEIILPKDYRKNTYIKENKWSIYFIFLFSWLILMIF